MKKLLPGAAVGLALAAALTALSYLADQALDIPFLAFAFFNWLTPRIPGPIITFGIDAMIDTMLFLRMDVANSAKAAEQVMSVAMFLALAAAAGAGAWLLLTGRTRRVPARLAGWLVAAGFAFFMVSLYALAGSLAVGGTAALFALWLAGLRWAVERENGLATAPPTPELTDPETTASVVQLNRRQFLVTLGASAAAITVAGTGLGLALAAGERRRLGSEAEDDTADRLLPNAGDPVTLAPGTRPEYTPVADHYKVFLELEPRDIPAEGYVLPIAGLVDNPLMLSVDDLYNRFDSFDQFVTLSCISGRIGTTLISTTKWTGISMQDLLAEAGVQPGARYLYIESADGFYESVPLELIERDRRIMLCHSWDDRPLPMDHGFPCRIWIPDRFGMKQPKWIVRMELVDDYREGYWVERGWDEIAQVKTTSVIDTVATEEIGLKGGQRVIPVGGIAWAGDRQISKVEVRVNGGAWEAADLRSPLSETTWVIWRYNWPFSEGNHVFEVRAFEGDGTPQIEAQAAARPSGSTGIHSREADI